MTKGSSVQPIAFTRLPTRSLLMGKGPDIIATVRFFTTEEGGRKSPTPSDSYRSGLIEFQGEKFSCFLDLDESGPISPGATATVPISFLYQHYIKPQLQVGSLFRLWELGTIAEGVVEQVLPD